MSSLHNTTEQLALIKEALDSHNRRLTALADLLLGPDYPDGGLVARSDRGTEAPEARPTTLMGEFDQHVFGLRNMVERIGATTSRLESVIADPRMATASASKY